jgi:hypothetical protein
MITSPAFPRVGYKIVFSKIYRLSLKDSLLKNYKLVAMPIIELQIKASAFLVMQRNVLRNLAICPPALPSVFGVQIVMDRIEFGNSMLRHNKPASYTTLYSEDGELVPTPNQPSGFQTQLAQDVTVYLTTQADILAHPNSTPALVPLTATLVYDLSFLPFENEGGPFDHSFDGLEHDCNLLAHISSVEWGPPPFLPPNFSPLNSIPPEIVEQIKTFMLQQLRLFAPGGTAPVGLNALPKQMRFINAGMSVDGQMQFIAIRVQVGGGSNMDADIPWADFYRGAIDDRLQGKDFTFFIESSLLTEKIKYEVDSNLPTDDNLETFPNCVYTHSDGKAVLTIDVLIIYHLYRNHYLDIDVTVEADPKVSIELTIAHPNELTVDFDFSHLLDSDDPLVNFVLGFVRTLGIPLQEILFTLAGNYILPELKDNVSDNCKKTSPTHIRCSKQIKTPLAPGSIQTSLTQLLTFDNGLAFAGTLNVKDLTAAVISTAVREFKITVPSISCGAASIALVAAFRDNPRGFGVLTAKGFIRNTGTAPMRLCTPLVVQRGAAGPFPVQNMKPDGSMAPFDININIAAPDSNYYNAPYPLDLLVKTSGGTRLLRFNPPPVITDNDNKRLAAELLVKIGNCEVLVDEWARLHHGYNPLWGPRPGDAEVVRHQWEVIVTGLKAGEKVALLDLQNREITSAVSSGGPMRLMTVVAPAAEKELSIKHIGRQSAVAALESMFNSTDEKEQEEAKKGIEVRQTLLMYKGSVPLRGKCKNLMAVDFAGRQCVAAVLQDNVVLYDFSKQNIPVPIKSWGIYGVRGVINWLGGLLAYGDEGLQWCNNGNKRNKNPAGLCRAAKDVAAYQRTLYAITHEGIQVYSARMCQVASAEVEHAESIIALGDKLIIGGRRGLTIADRHDLTHCHHHMSELCVTNLRAAFAGEPGLFVAQLADGTAKSFRIRNDAPEVVSEFAEAPWYSNAMILRDLTVKLANENNAFDLYRVGQMELA